MRTICRLFKEEHGQDALEYLLVVGAVVVALVIGFMVFDAVIEGFMGIVCPSVDPEGPGVGIGTCITSIGS